MSPTGATTSPTNRSPPTTFGPGSSGGALPGLGDPRAGRGGGGGGVRVGGRGVGGHGLGWAGLAEPSAAVLDELLGSFAGAIGCGTVRGVLAGIGYLALEPGVR